MIFSIAFRNIKKHWKKSLATILAISSSLIAQVLFVGYISRAKDIFTNMFSNKSMYGHLIIEDERRLSNEGKDAPLKYALDEKTGDRLREWLQANKNEVEAAVRFLNFSGMISNGKNQLIVTGRGNDFEQSERMRGPFIWNAKYGIPLEKALPPHQVMLGMQLGRWMGCMPEKEIKMNLDIKGYPAEERPFQCEDYNLQLLGLTESEQINALNVRTVGLTDGGVREIDARLLVSDLVTAQTLLNTKKISYATLRWKNESAIAENTKRLNDFLHQINPHLRAIPWSQHEDGRLYVESVDLLNVFQYFIVVVVLIITGMSVFNTCLKSILERVKEIGTLLSLGFQKSTIQILFMAESFLLALLGNGIGIIAAIIITTAVNALKVEYKAGIYSEAALLFIKTQPQVYFYALLVTTVTSLLTTTLTTRHFLKRRIIQNLNG